MLTSGMKSSEFWLALGTSVLTYFVPDFPVEALYTVMAYVVSRGLAKWAGN